MNKKNLIDIDCLSNGEGKKVYGGRLDAYAFTEITCEAWFEDFTQTVVDAAGKRYLPVYRMADGEMRFLFGEKINWRARPLRSIARYVKYEVFKKPWKTSWNEAYSPAQKETLRVTLRGQIRDIAEAGKLAVYWNENGLHAFTEYTPYMEDLFGGIGIRLGEDNYIPFHFGQALIARHSDRLIRGNNVLIVSGMGEQEFDNLQHALTGLGAAHVEQYRCSATAALQDDYSRVSPRVKPDIVLVAAGIGAAKVLVGLRHLECPLIDIGSYIHVLSGKSPSAHAGFFVSPIEGAKQ